MTFAKLIILSKHTDQVKRSSLSASKDLESRIINVAKHDLGSQFRTHNDYLVLKDDGMIPLHKLLNWINLMGYQLRSTMIFETNTGYYNGKSCYEKYVFEKVLG